MDTPAKKKTLKSFQTYRNQSPWKKIRAVSFEEAKGKLIKEIQTSKDRQSHYEIKDEQGRLIPIL